MEDKQLTAFALLMLFNDLLCPLAVCVDLCPSSVHTTWLRPDSAPEIQSRLTDVSISLGDW